MVDSGPAEAQVGLVATSTEAYDGKAEPTPTPAPPSWALLGWVATVSLVADVGTKAWAHAALAGWDGVRRNPKKWVLIDGFFAFTFAQNPGGAWSFLRGWPDGVRRPFFLFVSASASVLLVAVYRRLHATQRSLAVGLALALGGALGNLVDRMRYGWVIDFIDVYVRWGGREHHWPTFNVADIAIVVGVVLMVREAARAARTLP